MKHTFLFEPGVWTGEGTFWGGDELAHSALARVEIAHRDSCWLLTGALRVLSSPPVEFMNAYSIELPDRDPSTMKWTSENATLGRLQGVFSAVGESILSIFHSVDGGYQGTEHLMQMNPRQYHACAMLLLHDRKLSSWHITFTRAS